MWLRKRLDIDWADLCHAVWFCAVARGADEVARRIEARWSPAGDAVVCLSVRSGFDLLLKALALPAGSEVLVSALTIRDMPRILEERGLVPVPVDVDLSRLGPTRDQLERSLSSKTRAILTAHLFGSRMPLDELLEFSRRHGLLVFEDCAQAYDGPDYRGHPDADVSMFSFGTIKTATSLGGAVLRVRDAALRDRIRQLQARRSQQSQFGFLQRVAKYSALKALSGRRAAATLIAVCRMFGIDFDRWMNRTVRGFPGPDFFERIRRQPCAALLRLLERRLNQNSQPRLRERESIGARLAGRLRPAVRCPGEETAYHSYWVFPVIVEDPPPFLDALRAAGFDATQGESLIVVLPPDGRPETLAEQARRALTQLVYLPCYPGLPPAEVDRLADVVLSHLARTRLPSQSSPTSPPTPASIAGRSA